MILKIIIVVFVICMLLGLERLIIAYFSKVKDTSKICQSNCNKCRKYKRCKDVGKIVRKI